MHTNNLFESAHARVAAFIDSATVAEGSESNSVEALFDALALEVFELQFSQNQPYRNLCLSRGKTPDSIRQWSDIPAVPTSAFKAYELTCIEPGEVTRVFRSSGTTEQTRSRALHSAQSLALYERSLAAGYGRWLCDRLVRVPAFRILSLTPPSSEVPESSLAHMFTSWIQRFGVAGSESLGNLGASGDGWQVDRIQVAATIANAREDRVPVLLLGTAFNFVQLLDAGTPTMPLPPGSVVLETGGYKGRTRELSKTELNALICEGFEVEQEQIASEYGMAELSSQAYECRNSEAGSFRFPPWARIRIVSTGDGREVEDGQVGLLQVFDLANLWSVMAIQTGDLVRKQAGGFELLGRASTEDQKGCSLQVAAG